MAAPYRFTDPNERFSRAYQQVGAMRSDRARVDAGNALTSGNYSGAADALYGAGEVELGAKVAGVGEDREAARAKATKDREAEVLSLTGNMAGRLSTILDESKDDPTAAVGAFDQFFAPQLRRLGETDEEIDQIRGHLGTKPRETLIALGAGAAKAMGFEVQGSGEEVLVIDKGTGKLVNRFRGARTVSLPEGGSLYDLPGSYGDLPSASPSAGGSASGEARASAAAPSGAASLMPHLIQQESGGDGNAVGPMTDYGQAFGSTQMLPATAESMARKLGLAWRPDLMRGDTKNALEYQSRLGEAYLQEGLDKYGGDARKGLMYYHGGPDESLWGPKTNAYADSVLRRMGQGGGAPRRDEVQPYEVAANGETPPPPAGGPRLIAQRPKAVDPLKELQRQNLESQVLERQEKTADRDQKLARSKEAAQAKAATIVTAVDDALSKIGRGEAGFVGAKMSEVPGTKAYDVARQIETIKANLGFQELQAMRESSPTGGALGAIAVQELVALQSTVANLDIGQSEQQLRSNLGRIKAHYQRWLDTVNKSGGEGGGSGESPAIARAREAIRKGASRAAVRKRLIDNGIDPTGI